MKDCLRRPAILRHNALFAVALLGAATISGCKKSGDDTPQPVVTVEAERPKIGGISERITADATLSPLAQAAISSKITAPVRTFFVQRGSKVKVGQLLAVLENRDLSAQALDNKGQYTAAQATYDIQTKAQAPEEYAKAQLDVAQLKAQLHLQGEIAASRQKLFQQGAISGRDYDIAVAAQAQAQAAYDTARNRLHALTAVSAEATRRFAQGQLYSAKGRLEAAEAQVSYSHIQSPISGVVTDRALFPGETAAAGTPIVTVMDTSSLLAKLHLSQSIAQRLSLGDDASVRIPGVDQPVSGKVTLISPALDPGSATVEVWLKIGNGEGTYKAGTPVRVSVVGRTVAHTIKVPMDAIFTGEDGTQSVMTVGGDGTAQKVGIQTGINDGEDVQVTQGLSGSELVITHGAYGLSDGSRVAVGKPSDDGERK